MVTTCVCWSVGRGEQPCHIHRHHVCLYTNRLKKNSLRITALSIVIVQNYASHKRSKFVAACGTIVFYILASCLNGKNVF